MPSSPPDPDRATSSPAPTSDNPPCQRIHFLVMGKEQWLIVAKVVSVSLVSALCYWLSTFYFVGLVRSELGTYHLDPTTLAAIENTLTRSITSVFAVATAASLTYGLYLGIYLSHKVVGPIYKLSQHLQEPSSSDLTFRRGDYFQGLPTTINKLRSTNSSSPPAPESSEPKREGHEGEE